jgi:hypothetical protein
MLTALREHGFAAAASSSWQIQGFAARCGKSSELLQSGEEAKIDTNNRFLLVSIRGSSWLLFFGI